MNRKKKQPVLVSKPLLVMNCLLALVLLCGFYLVIRMYAVRDYYYMDLQENYPEYHAYTYGDEHIALFRAIDPEEIGIGDVVVFMDPEDVTNEALYLGSILQTPGEYVSYAGEKTQLPANCFLATEQGENFVVQLDTESLILETKKDMNTKFFYQFCCVDWVQEVFR
ncbi:MAG: hypothetical protein K6C69_01955 [Lachnospiraceae bacterium]|nr:hypothetical protein [Lachnospiraceae bacterium]